MPYPPAKDGSIYAIYMDQESATAYFKHLSFHAELLEGRKPDPVGRVIVEWATFDPEGTINDIRIFMKHHGLPEPTTLTFFEVPQSMHQDDLRVQRNLWIQNNRGVDTGW